MNPQRWQQIKVALDQALELEGAPRIAYIDRITADDAEMRGELQALILAYDEAGEEFLNTPAALACGDLIGPDPWVGKHIGPYQLVELIGSGGMGEVYRGIRADDEYQKQVAIKLIRTGQSSARLIRRFRNERQILASFEHPNIARMLDGGTAGDGVPYFVMELIEGEPINQYCDSRKLDILARLHIFLKVCRAVQYAHQHLVIHRDLKPNNILVTADGEPKLLDFGIAKILAPAAQPGAERTDDGVAAGEYTRTEFRLLTPEYASPEQINGEPLTTASDVYSLGVLLYDLLTGHRPRVQASPDSPEPRKPSSLFRHSGVSRDADAANRGYVRAGSARRLRRRLRGDLDNIVMMALRRDPARRYDSVENFAQDIRRHLDSLPVRARRDTIRYRSAKLARRHQSALKGAAAAALGIIAILAFGAQNEGWFANRVASPKPGSPADALDPKSVAVLPFVDLSEQQDQGYLSDGLSEELIDRLSNISDLRVPASTSSFFFKGKKAPIAEIAKKLQVANILEGSVRSAGSDVRITVQLIDAASGFHRWSQTYQRNLKDVLQVQTDVAGSVAKALKVTLTGEDIAKIGSGGTSDAAAYEAYLRGEQRLIVSNDRKSDNAAALVLFDQAIALDADYALAHAGRARALDTLAIFHSDSKEREAVRRQALAAAQRAVALAPDLGETHVALAITLAYGMLDFRAAEPEFALALTLAPGSARVQRLYAEYSAAMGHHEQAIAAARRAVSLDPQAVGSHVTLGRALDYAKQHLEALVAFHDAAALKPDSNFILGHIAAAMIAAGQLEPARQQCESRSVALTDDNRRWCLALVYHLLGRQSDAERELAELKKSQGDEPAFAYAEIYATWGDIPLALAWLATAERQRDPALQGIRASYWLDPLRAYPEFEAIEATMRFPP
jgi:eukaryotic-like serine/threonine-protein kinase